MRINRSRHYNIYILTDVKDKERPDEKQDVIYKMICFDSQTIYSSWADWKKLKHTTYKAVTSLEETRQDIVHCQTSPTNETQHWLGFGNMNCIQHLIQTTTYFRKLVYTNLERNAREQSQKLPAPYRQTILHNSRQTIQPVVFPHNFSFSQFPHVSI